LRVIRVYKQANDLSAEVVKQYAFDEDELEELMGSERPQQKLSLPQSVRERSQVSQAKLKHIDLQDMYNGKQSVLPETFIGSVDIVEAPGGGWYDLGTGTVQDTSTS
jgi:hypothetical protein